MFTLSIDGKQLILATDFSVPLIYTNPCWCFNEIPGPLCLDVTIPDNDVNRNHLGHPGRFAKMAKSNDREFPRAEMRWGGFLYIYGTLVITKPTESGYAGYIKNELRTLSDKQREKVISDHQLGGEIAFENKLNYDPDTDLYCTLRLMNSGFWVDKGQRQMWKRPIVNQDGSAGTEDVETEVLTRKFETVDYLVNCPGDGGVKTADYSGAGIVVVSPFPFLARLIELLLRENKFFIRESFLSDDDDLKTLCLYNNRSICKTIDTKIPRQTTLYDQYYQGPGTGPGIEVTSYMIQLQSWVTDSFQMKKLLPKMELPDLLLSVQNLTNTFFHFSGIDDVDNIDRESLFDMEPFDLSRYRVSRWLPGTRQNKCLKFSFSHDSDDQEFNKNFADISSREEDIKEPVTFYADLTAPEMPEPKIGHIRLVKVEKMYYEYRQETVEARDLILWAPFTIDIQDYKYNELGTETEDIKTNFSTLRMHKNGYPVAYQKGNSSQFSQFSENFGPRLLFYNGNNTGGSSSIGGLDINWKSITEKRFRRTSAFYANALPVEASFRFPGNILYKILNSIYIPFLDRDGVFFIKEMEIQAGNSNYVDATLTVYKNEDNVFVSTIQTVDGEGGHVGGGGGSGEPGEPVFTPVFVGLTATGQPMLIDALGMSLPVQVFGQLSSAPYSKYTCSDYDPAFHLLFVGGNNGMLHVCDLSDMNNIRYKTIQIFPGTDEISAVSIVTSGFVKSIMIGRTTQTNTTSGFSQPYHISWDDYVSNEAVAMGLFDHGTGVLRGFIFTNGYYHACTSHGEVFRTADPAAMWNQVADIDGSGGYGAEFVAIAHSGTRIWTAEINDDSLYALKTNTAQYNRYGGLAGTARQKLRSMRPTLGDHMLIMCDDLQCIWEVDPANNINRNITPSGIKKAGGSCFDGVKFAHVCVMDSAGYPKIVNYNADVSVPEGVWSYLNVTVFLEKLWKW